MLIVREVFVCKPGQAGKAAKMFRASMPADAKCRILTDYVGDYNTVVMEMEVESLAAWEQQMEEYRSGKKQMSGNKEDWADWHSMWKAGRREVWKVVE